MPWTQIKALRNVVAHNYGKIDDESLWETITSDIPKLKDYCLNIIQQLVNKQF
nr:HepT-like ribonuclease domain-containing protein [Desulfosporosinus nitroreducens]